MGPRLGAQLPVSDPGALGTGPSVECSRDLLSPGGWPRWPGRAAVLCWGKPLRPLRGGAGPLGWSLRPRSGGPSPRLSSGPSEVAGQRSSAAPSFLPPWLRPGEVRPREPEAASCGGQGGGLLALGPGRTQAQGGLPPGLSQGQWELSPGLGGQQGPDHLLQPREAPRPPPATASLCWPLGLHLLVGSQGTTDRVPCQRARLVIENTRIPPGRLEETGAGARGRRASAQLLGLSGFQERPAQPAASVLFPASAAPATPRLGPWELRAPELPEAKPADRGGGPASASS